MNRNALPTLIKQRNLVQTMEKWCLYGKFKRDLHLDACVNVDSQRDSSPLSAVTQGVQ